METIILNCSPKGDSKKSNSKIFANEFVRYMKKPCQIKHIADTNLEELINYVEDFDVIILILPLYIHAMPAIAMKFIELMKPSRTKDKYIGFIIQAGFIESSQHRFVEAYFEELAAILNRNYLGTVSKGEAAGIYMYPKMFKKVLRLLNDLGRKYEEKHVFDEDIKNKLANPYELTGFKLFILKSINKLGLGNIGWHRMLKKENAYDKRLDKPFV